MSKDSSKPAEPIHLLPYQADMVEKVINARIPARFLLSSPPGVGKSFAMAALAGALRGRSDSSRCLAIVPVPMLLMWQEELRRFAGIDALVMTPQTYRSLQAETSKGFNVWTNSSAVVVSIDFLKSGARVEEMLAAPWDLIIIDEIQLCSATSQRDAAAKKIWDDPVVPRVVGATGVPHGTEWLFEKTSTQRIHWKNEDLAQYMKLPQRRVEIVKYALTDVERDISTRIFDVVRNAPKTSEAEFIGRILLRRLASSMYALEQSVRNLLAADRYPEDTAEDEGVALEEIVKSLEEVGSSVVSKGIGMNPEAAEQILVLLEAEPKDSKWECCEQLLRQRGIGESCSGVIFTDFRDTAQYLEYLANSRGLKTFSINGSSPIEQREQALEGSRSGPSILIVTTAAAEGFSLAYTNQVVHYDLPWDPMALLQRYGRVERLGSQFQEIYHYYLVAQESPTEAMLQGLLNKLHSIEEAFG
jgi:superfamily II DNA or RNA helicase